jgi:Uma2 family endonuclease
MASLSNTLLTPEQYLEIERKAVYKSEYYQGEMLPMPGASRGHNLIVSNTLALLHPQLRGTAFEVYPSDMRVLVGDTGLYTYPDIVVARDPHFLEAGLPDTLLDPIVIVEVLSPSTEAYDRGKKFELYRALESLRDYVLIASERIEVEHFSRQPNGQWLFTAAGHLEDSITVESIGCTLHLADVYERVRLDA